MILMYCGFIKVQMVYFLSFQNYHRKDVALKLFIHNLKKKKKTPKKPNTQNHPTFRFGRVRLALRTSKTLKEFYQKWTFHLFYMFEPTDWLAWFPLQVLIQLEFTKSVACSLMSALLDMLSDFIEKVSMPFQALNKNCHPLAI